MGLMPRIAATRPPGGRRASAASVAARLRFVEELLAAGATRYDLMAKCWRRYKMPPRTVDEYARRVRAAWAADAAMERPYRREEARARLLQLRERLLAARAWSSLVAVERLLVEIDGARSPELLNVNARVENDVMTDEEATLTIERAARAAARYRARHPDRFVNAAPPRADGQGSRS